MPQPPSDWRPREQQSGARTQKFCFSPTTIHPRRSGPVRSWARRIRTPARLLDSTTWKCSITCARNWFVCFRREEGEHLYRRAGREMKSQTQPFPCNGCKRANAFPVECSFQDVRPSLDSLRTYKDVCEIERIRHATDASIAAHLSAMHSVKPRHHRAGNSALDAIRVGETRVVSGRRILLSWDRVSIPRCCTIRRIPETIQAGDVIVIDAAGEYSMYASDITRTLPCFREIHSPSARDL